ncbi:Transferase [Sesbania bispinosa]|nr:Transferase [Sesbania bispinosa]
MLKSVEFPDCFYPRPPITIPPSAPTPEHSLHLSNIDQQKLLRFSIKYLYFFKKSVNLDILKSSLSRVLVDYYPLAGRLRASNNKDDRKLEVDCNGEGALFAEAFLEATAEELLESSKLPNKSWRKLLYKVDNQSFLDVPPLVIQVTSLRCGSQPLMATSFTFGASEVLRLKKQCVPSLKRITTFEAVAAHTWRSWVRSLNLCSTLNVKLLFSVNVRKKINLPEGYYGNGFVLACAESTVKDLVAADNLGHGLKLVQQAKASLDDVVEVRIGRFGFGEGKPLHMGALTSSVYCLFLPVVGDANALGCMCRTGECGRKLSVSHDDKGELRKKERKDGDVNTNRYHAMRDAQHSL